MRMRLNTLALAGTLATVPLGAQTRDYCRDASGWGDRYERHCEIREYTLANIPAVAIDGGANGGITVEAWDRDEILIEAVVVGQAYDLDRAREIAGNVEVSANSASIRADGPRTGRREGWWVTWHVRAPAGVNLDLVVVNGGIRITGMAGTTRFRATNGGVTLADLSGNVSGASINGGLQIELTGARWDGAGLDVRATNGGVRMVIPEGFSGEFETGTVNGRLDLGFPITVQGRFGGRDLRFSLGDGGGPALRASTTNGGVRISRG